MQEPARVALSLIGIVIIIAGAYYATYYIGLRASGRTGKGRARNKGRNRSIELLERFAISKDKSFCIVKIASKIYVIGITNQSMTVIDMLEALEYEKHAEESENTTARNVVSGGPFSGKAVNKLAAFMAQRMAKKHGTAENKAMKSETFAKSMETAREKNNSGQPEREKAERPDSSEEEE